MTFEQWMQKVNLLFLAEFGVDADEFPDYLWRDEFKNGFTPQQAYDYWCKNEGPDLY
jgi:hypothetical protein